MAIATTTVIRSLARVGRYTLSLHAERERQADRITMGELEAAISGAEIIEEYPDDPRGASCLVPGSAATARSMPYAPSKTSHVKSC